MSVKLKVSVRTAQYTPSRL